jgi:hypothetical protein
MIISIPMEDLSPLKISEENIKDIQKEHTKINRFTAPCKDCFLAKDKSCSILRNKKSDTWCTEVIKYWEGINHA